MHSDDAVLTTVIGLDDIVVVTTVDAVLVVARDKAEDVKTLVERLKAENRREAIEHRRIYRPWGYYQGIDIGGRYQVKRIVVKPGEKLSLQKHFHRAEHWVVVKGAAEVTINDDVRIIHENESILYPDRQRPPPRQSGQDPDRTDRGAGRQLSRRGRHRAPRRHLPA